MKIPKVGTPVRGSTSGRPIMVAFDLLGRRATLRLLWELREQALNFRALVAAAETNPSLLNTRLKELRAARLVELRDDGYALTDEGRDLLQALQPLLKWATRWGKTTAKLSG
jgi:DNA-binding HxlR family transcriptional regulator